MAVCCAVLCVGCQPAEEAPYVAKAPDYRKTAKNNAAFTFYSYSSVSNGLETRKDENGNRYTVEIGPDCITEEKFLEYKACGLEILMPQSVATVGNASAYQSGGNTPLWKTVLDLAKKTGLKVLLTDNPLMYASSGESSDKSLYESDAAMDAFVRAQLLLYAKHPAFYGVLLRDEVSAKVLKSGTFGKVYRSIKRVEAELIASGEIKNEIFIHINLRGVGSYYQGYSDHTGDAFPELSRLEYYAIMPALTYKPHSSETDEEFYERVEAQIRATKYADRVPLRYTLQRARYRKLVELLLDETGADHFAIDLYPMYEAGPMTVYLMGLQVGAEVAKERGVEMHIVTQATSFPFGDPPNTRILTENDMRWLNNTLLGFGVKTICYYGYFEPSEAIVGSSMMLDSGVKTPLWDACNQIMKENRAFESTILNFDFVGSKGYQKSSLTYAADYVTYLPNALRFQWLKDVEWDKETLFVTEMYDENKGNYMYMALNAIDPKEGMNTNTLISATLTFDPQFTHAVVWKNGKKTEVELLNGKLDVQNFPGEAVYVIPYK